MNRRLLSILFFAATALAAEVGGNWTGTMALNSGNNSPAYLHLEQNGNTITGTQGPSEDRQVKITRGEINGEQITVEAQPGASVLKLVMQLQGNKLSGDVYEDGEKIGTVSLQKAAR